MRRAGIPLLALLLAACPAVDEPLDDDDDATDAPELEAEDLPASIAAAFAEEADGAGAAIAVFLDGRLYAGAVGTKDPDGGDPVAPTTLFRIGSTTKMMTATAVLAAADRGELSVSDPVVDHLPGLDIDGVAPFEDITLHHLLTHTAGVREITPIDGGAADERLQDFTFGGFTAQCYSMAPAGAFWNYSNPNFSLAGAALEATDGRWYRDIVAEDVWGPLGMDRTYFLGEDVAADGDFAEADTYDWTGQTAGRVRVGATTYDDAWSRPAGFAWSNVLDMARWGRFLVDGDPAVIEEASHAALIAPQVPTAAFRDRLDYGYGVMRWHGTAAGDGWYEVETAQHNGAIPGYAAEVITVPDRGLVVATLAAADGAYFSDTLQVVFEDLLGLEAVPVPDAGIAGDDRSRYVGTYEDPFNVGTVEVTLSDSGQLRWTMPRLDGLNVPYGHDLTQTSVGNFAVSIQGAPTSVSFLTEDGSEVGPTRWLRHRAFVADRSEQRGTDAEGPLRPLFGPTL
jgi:CubicO group peptidase (beta-lactamase class C family)